MRLATAPTGTPALSVLALARMMQDAARRTFDVDLRFHGETDAVLHGKVTQLDVIAESVWMADHVLTYEEEKAMKAAQEDLSRAWNHLAEAIAAP